MGFVAGTGEGAPPSFALQLVHVYIWIWNITIIIVLCKNATDDSLTSIHLSSR